MTDIRFDGRVAIITGAGGGIGRQHALLLASRGARVVVNDLGTPGCDGRGASSAAAEAVVAEIIAAGGEAVADAHTVATPEGGEAIVAAAMAAYGRVDILINNAGILRDRSFAKMTWEDLDAVLDVHLKGAFFVTRPAFLRMKEAGYGRIIFTSSGSGIFGNFGQSNYAAAKCGLIGLANVIGIEGRKYNILTNTIAPIARTRMTEHLLGPTADRFQAAQVSPLVAYLASEENSLNQEVFSVGGGRVARIFTGVTRGYFHRGGMTVESVRESLAEASDPEGYVELGSMADETRLMLQVIGEG